MIHYFRRYLIVAVVIAGCIPLVVTTVWSWIVGFNIIATFYGLIAALLILFVSMYCCVRYATRLADAKAQQMVALYDEQCDPQAFLDSARDVLAAITGPVQEPGAWFLAIAGQAFLDVGKPDEAKRCLSDLLKSARTAKNDEIRTGILTNAIPLSLKLDGPEKTDEMIESLLEILETSANPHMLLQATYLHSQRQLCAFLMQGNDAALLERYRAVRGNDRVVMRMRVEYAWNEARLCYTQGLRDEEIECLHFIVDHGGTLAFVPTARGRLAALGG